MLTKRFIPVFFFAFILVHTLCAIGSAAGPFGPPESVPIKEGGLQTAFGYWYNEDKYANGTDHVVRQNQLYSELGYGFAHSLEIYGRIGVADLKILNAFSSSDVSTTTAKNDFSDNWQLFGTLGAKGFYPIDNIFGIGTFIQGTYSFSDFSDSIAGARNGAAFASTTKVENPWDINFGVGFQAAIPAGVKLYAGPYIYYAEAKVSSSPNVPGVVLPAADATLKNKLNVGGFAGIDVPIGKGFHMNLEGQCAERFSGGVAVTLVY